ncbi:hypothetical protein TDB9533_00818 [Thalassocella blandensis]|nr:hypothetical protein TDB9533_00818 [Thalassocella blandensis]
MSEPIQNTCSWYDPSCALTWLSDELKALGLWLWESLLNGAAAVFEVLPVPDFMLDAGTIQIPPGVAWAAEPFQLEYGLTIIVSAYIGRFILRRIPIIG